MRLLNYTAMMILSLVIFTVLSGCAHFEVVPIPNRDIIALNADDIVLIMNRAGFSEEEIIELGTDVRNALASTGAARAERGDKTEVVFSVDDKFVYINSRTRGQSIYDPEKALFSD